MTPDFRILANQDDITEVLRDRLISIRVTDEAGFQSDTVEIALDDRDRKIAMPASGTELEVWLGYKDTGLTFLGNYTVDEIAYDLCPRRLILPATAANMKSSLKAPKSRSWDEVTLIDIVKTIAAEHNLEPKVSASLGEKFYQHIDQTDESDLHFMTRLAREIDAVAKPVMNRLVFVPKGEARSPSGKEFPVVQLSYTDLAPGSQYRSSDRDKYTAVKAYWQDKELGKRVSEQVGSGDMVYSLRGNRPNSDEARRAATSKLKSLKRGSGSVSLKLPKGWPDIRAEGKVELSGCHEKIDGFWSVTRVVHSYQGSGFTTQVEAETPTR